MVSLRKISGETAAQLLSVNNVGIWMCEQDPGKPPRLYGDAGLFRIFGVDGTTLTPEETYHLWYDNISPDYRKLVEDSVARMADGHLTEVVYPWSHPVLGETWVRCGGCRDMSYTAGIRIEGLHRDISNLVQVRKGGFRPDGACLASEFVERRPATTSPEWQVDESLDLWREIADSFPNMLFIKDADNGWRYCYSNAQHRDFVGVDPTGKTDVENFGEVSGERWHDEDKHMFETGKGFNNNSTYFNFVEGDRFYNMRKYPLVTQSGHRYVIGIGTDITDLYFSQLGSRLQLAVQDVLSEAKDDKDYTRRTMSAILKTVPWIPRIFFRDMALNSPPLCLRQDGAGGVVEVADDAFRFANSAAWQDYLNAIPVGESRLCTDIAAIEPASRGLGLHACLCFAIQYEGRTIGQMSLFTNRRGPTSDYAEMLAQTIRDVLIYAYCRWTTKAGIQELEAEKDRIAASRLAEAQAAERAKSLFLASMSHEIRTPLNAVIGLCLELQNDDLSAEVRKDYLRSISEASRALLDLINDVLDISKLESGHFQLAIAETGAAELTRACGAIFADSAAQHNLDFAVRAPSEALVVRIDAHRVRQILINLLGNAVKFTQKGGVELICRFDAEDAESGTLSFSVADTGIGISEEDRARVFGMFEQASGLRGTRVANAGTGLGLALCQRLTAVMGGELQLKSKLGEGSIFTLRLPHVGYRMRSAAECTAIRAAAKDAEPTGAYTGKVLIVDDVPLNLKVMGVMLARAGIRYAAANGASAALKALGREHFDAMLTDLWMPDMSGEALTKYIRADSRFAGLRIAAVTADIDVSKSFDPACFDAVLPKPITIRGILDFLCGRDLANGLKI